MVPQSWRVGSIEPWWRHPAQSNGGHAAGLRKRAGGAQNPAYRRASHFFHSTRSASLHKLVGLRGRMAPRGGVFSVVVFIRRRSLRQARTPSVCNRPGGHPPGAHAHAHPAASGRGQSAHAQPGEWCGHSQSPGRRLHPAARSGVLHSAGMDLASGTEWPCRVWKMAGHDPVSNIEHTHFLRYLRKIPL